MNEIPGGWSQSYLGEVINGIEAGKNIRCAERPPELGERGIVKISAVSWGYFDETESKTTLPGAEIDERSRIAPGDLLISRANTMELVGACVRVGAIERALYLSDKVLRLRAPSQILPWLHRYLCSPQARTWLSEASSGNQLSMRNISQAALRELPVPFAPIEEQQRVCRKLDGVLARVKTCRERLDRVPQILKKFREAVLEAAVSGRLTEEWRRERGISLLDWRATTFNFVSEYITVGHVGKMSSEYVASGVPFLRSLNVRPLRFDRTNLQFISEDFHKSLPKSKLKPGDVVVVRTGAPGQCCVIPAELSRANCSDLVILRPLETLNPYFACIYINSAAAQRFVRSEQVGVAQLHFNVGSMKKTPVQLPSIEEQAEIARRVDELHALADGLQRRHNSAAAFAEKLMPSVLGKAFRGELVPQDPTDEPAETLLKWIRQGSGISEVARNKARSGGVRRQAISPGPARQGDRLGDAEAKKGL